MAVRVVATVVLAFAPSLCDDCHPRHPWDPHQADITPRTSLHHQVTCCPSQLREASSHITPKMYARHEERKPREQKAEGNKWKSLVQPIESLRHGISEDLPPLKLADDIRRRLLDALRQPLEGHRVYWIREFFGGMFSKKLVTKTCNSILNGWDTNYTRFPVEKLLQK